MYLTLMEFLTNYFTPVGNNKFPLTTYSDIEKLMKLNFPNLIIFIYKNKDEIHEILYDEDNFNLRRKRNPKFILHSIAHKI